jgi:ectoine hydroxylase-related dioxygenase (phytanoyl-CoA dioxygenase family)
VITPDECKLISNKLDHFHQKEIEQYGEDYLKQIHEFGTIRALIDKDIYFEKTILNNEVFNIISKVLGDTAILHLHNGIVIHSETKHRQAMFHRDFQKNFSSNKPLSLNAFWAIDDFNEKTGGTLIVPKTHKMDYPPDEYLQKNEIQIVTNSGSVLVFDSRLIHRGGINTSGKPRRALNHQYTLPFIKQQIDFPNMLKGKIDAESKLAQTLGFWTIPPKSVEEFRADPEKRSYRSGQG